jgi:hypothetical protein
MFSSLTQFLLQLQIFAADKTYSSTDIDRACNHSFFGFPTWYKYLKPPVDGSGNLAVGPDGHTLLCTPAIGGLSDFWLIGLAVIEMLLRIAILIAIIFVMLGGFKYITARGEAGRPGIPDKLNSAKLTVYDALIGLVIAIVATALVSFIAGRFTQS